MEPNGKNRVGIQYRLVVKCIDSGINLRISLSCAVFIRLMKESWPTVAVFQVGFPIHYSWKLKDLLTQGQLMTGKHSWAFGILWDIINLNQVEWPQVKILELHIFFWIECWTPMRKSRFKVQLEAKGFFFSFLNITCICKKDPINI